VGSVQSAPPPGPRDRGTARRSYCPPPASLGSASLADRRSCSSDTPRSKHRHIGCEVGGSVSMRGVTLRTRRTPGHVRTSRRRDALDASAKLRSCGLPQVEERHLDVARRRLGAHVPVSPERDRVPARRLLMTVRVAPEELPQRRHQLEVC
jgi:hypothetical protein